MNCIRWSVNVRLTSSIEREKNSLDLIKVYWRRNLKTFAKKILNVIVKLYWNEFQRMKRELIETHCLCNPNRVEILMKENEIFSKWLWIWLDTKSVSDSFIWELKEVQLRCSYYVNLLRTKRPKKFYLF